MEVEQEANQSQFEIYQNQCLENGKKMYLNTRTRDVQFLFGTKDNITTIPAHKAILATDSDVFEKMFYGDMKEPGDIHVSDSNEATFKEFLQYFYLSEVKLTAENLVDVLYLGAKYQVKKCVKNCVRSLIRSLDDENVCDQLNLAILYDQKKWIEACEERIMLNTAAVFNSVEFLKCDKNVLAHILKMDLLACSEIDVFKACMSWVKAKCDSSTDLSMELVERHLGNSFYDIRLASLTMDELCTLHTQYESVLTRDFIHITNIITQLDFPEPKFNKNPRHHKWMMYDIIKCERKIDYAEEEANHVDYHNVVGGLTGCINGECEFMQNYADQNYKYHLGLEENTTFSVRNPLFLGGLSCVSIDVWQGCDCDVKTEMEIIECSDLNGANSNALLKMRIKLKTNENDITEISLPHPVLIRPGFFYTIRLGPFPQRASYYCNDLVDHTILKPYIFTEIKFHNNYNHSLIKVLNFNQILF